MGKKSLGLGKAQDYAAGMRANAQAAMPEIMAAGKIKPRSAPVSAPAPKASVAMKNGGGKACYAAGGVAKIRHAQASKAGAPTPPKAKFRGKSGIGGG